MFPEYPLEDTMMNEGLDMRHYARLRLDERRARYGVTQKLGQNCTRL